MPSFRDELRTVLAIDNLSNYLSGLERAKTGNLDAVVALKSYQDSLTGVGRLLFKVSEGLGIQSGQWMIIATAIYGARAAFRAIKDTVDEAMRSFEKYDQVLFRTSFLFNSMGSPTGMRQLQGFARERSASTGISEDDTLSLAGNMRQTGFGTATIGRLLPLLQDLQASGRTSAANASDIINKLMHEEGRGRGSLGAISEAATTLRLDPRFFTGGQQHDLQEVIRQLTAQVGGLSENLSQQTISGGFVRNQTLMQDAMKRLGAVIEAALVPAIEVLNTQLLGFTRTIDLATNPNSSAGRVIRGTDEALQYIQNPIAQALHLLITGPLRTLQDEGGTEALRQQDETNKHLRNIESNTQNTATALMLSIFGSASTFTRQGAAWRNLQSAISFRG